MELSATAERDLVALRCDPSYISKTELLLQSRTPSGALYTPPTGSHDEHLSHASSVRERCGSFTSSTTDDSGYSAYSNAHSTVPLLVEQQRSVRGFQTQDEFEWAMREDLSDWFTNLYPQFNITPDYFFEGLEDGILLCHHLHEVHKSGEIFVREKCSRDIPIKMGKKFLSLPGKPPHLDRLAKPGAVTFRGRDNVANFLAWCKEAGMHSTLLFETEDLIQRKHTRNIVLCLLEIARIGAKFGIAVPDLIHLEQEIDAEIALECLEEEALSSFQQYPCSMTQPSFSDRSGDELDGNLIPDSAKGLRRKHLAGAPKDTVKEKETKKPTLICDLKSLDEMVRDIVSMCQCENMVFMKRLAEGKYLIGEKSTLIFVRILRNHVMVRVGGGWDTLNHFLEKHDPCRKRQTYQHGRQCSGPIDESPQNIAEQGNFREGQSKLTPCRPSTCWAPLNQAIHPEITDSDPPSDSSLTVTISPAVTVTHGAEECVTPRDAQNCGSIETNTAKAPPSSESSPIDDNKLQMKSPPRKTSVSSPAAARRISSPQTARKSMLPTAVAKEPSKTTSSRLPAEKSLKDKVGYSKEELLKTFPLTSAPKELKDNPARSSSRSHSNSNNPSSLCSSPSTSTKHLTNLRSTKGMESPKPARSITTAGPRNRAHTSIGGTSSPAASPASSPAPSRRITRTNRANSLVPNLPLQEDLKPLTKKTLSTVPSPV